MALKIGSFLDHSTIDYPEEIVAVLGLCGCPFRCRFCHNGDLVYCSKWKDMEIKEIKSMIDEYSDIITGVCITGGEPLFQVDGLISLVSEIKNKLINIDTNGYFPDRLYDLLKTDRIEYIAMDIKTDLDLVRYQDLTFCKDNKLIERIFTSLYFLTRMKDKGKLKSIELRTTIIPGINDNPTIIQNLCSVISRFNISCYVLNQFSPYKGTLDKSFEKITVMERDELLSLSQIAKEYIRDVRIRTTSRGEEKV